MCINLVSVHYFDHNFFCVYLSKRILSIIRESGQDLAIFLRILISDDEENIISI
jgi:hypothetical protein